ncbi:MAG: TRAP transporter large permease [Desulfofustis sp.]|nr:TRAP transporter large permease [Desulfofustis sp.]NNF45994.1 TRAP transporter large permease [Desulfofustis sp.]
MIIFWMFVGLFALIMINVPIAIALGIVAVVTMVIMQGVSSLPNVALVMFDGATKFPLLAIPLFIFAGAIMNTGGISKRLIAFASALVGFVKGGLAMASTATSMFFAEMSGSAVADVAALGSILIPAMKRKGYPGPFAAAVMSSAATIAVIIPPSIPMILYAVMAGSSVVKIFVAGIIPGIMCGLAMMALSYAFAVKRNYPVEEVFQLQRVWTTFKDASWAFIVPLIILGGIFGGFVTATEGAGLAVLASLFVGGVIYREINWEHLKEATIEGGISTGVVMLLVAASALMGTILTELQIPQQLAEKILGFTSNKYAVLGMLNLFFLVVGCFLHSAAAIILVVPIVMPLVHAVGIDPVHFGLVVTLNLGIGQQTPPVASVLITACSVAKADIWEVSKVNVWYVGCIFVILMICTYIPAIPMFLVHFFYG